VNWEQNCERITEVLILSLVLIFNNQLSLSRKGCPALNWTLRPSNIEFVWTFWVHWLQFTSLL